MGLRKNDEFQGWRLMHPIVDGSGGNGIVWEVTPKDGRRGAIKFLQRRHYKKSKRCKRFRHEVEALVKCADIVGVLPVWDHSLPEYPSDDNPAWFVSPMAVIVRDALGSEPSLRDAVEACASYARTLAEMHARDVSHRDIKPENLFHYEGEWMIGDFGLVDFPGKTVVTGPKERVGSFHYIAPEMATSADTADGKAADVYSLGKTLSVLTTHQHFPLPGPHRPDDPAYQIRSYNAEPGSERLDTLIAAATVVDPTQRCNMTEFGRSLEAWLEPIELKKQSHDFSHLRRLIDDMRQPDKVKEERRTKIMRQCETDSNRLLSHFREALGQLAEQLETADLPVGFHSPGSLRSEWFQRCHGETVRTGDRNELREKRYGAEASIKKDGTPHSLWIGVQILFPLVEPPRVDVNVIYMIQPPDICVWHDQGSFLLNGPEEPTVISRLTNGLFDNLESAVDLYLKEGLGVTEDHA